MIPTTAGERIKKRREMLGISVDDVANELGKNRATVYRYENGYIDDIPISIVSKLAHILCTTPEYLMGWTDSPEPRPSGFSYSKDHVQEHAKLFTDNYEAILYLLYLNECVDDNNRLVLQNLAGDSLEMTPAKRIDLLLAITKEAQSYVARGGTEGLNDAYDHLDEHGKSVVDAVLRLEQERMEKEKNPK